ncbi:hypothetical protein AB0M45_21840 [Nocardia sp. NPDC051787]|uniref:hypothetical protein n=1 Tax=Nocardia sp. NPDC051787 TaxID=3155415 RepID=UPI003422F44B
MLSETPVLRRLIITGDCRIRRMWLPQYVESLEINVPRSDLSALAGRPKLGDLTVSESAVRVEDLGALEQAGYELDGGLGDRHHGQAASRPRFYPLHRADALLA